MLKRDERKRIARRDKIKRIATHDKIKRTPKRKRIAIVVPAEIYDAIETEAEIKGRTVESMLHFIVKLRYEKLMVSYTLAPSCNQMQGHQ